MNESSNMGAYFHAEFDDKSDFNYEEYYDKLIGLIQKGGTKNPNKITYSAQYLTYEYCKVVNHDAKNISKTIKENPVSLFEIKWFLNIYINLHKTERIFPSTGDYFNSIFYIHILYK